MDRLWLQSVEVEASGRATPFPPFPIVVVAGYTLVQEAPALAASAGHQLLELARQGKGTREATPTATSSLAVVTATPALTALAAAVEQAVLGARAQEATAVRVGQA